MKLLFNRQDKKPNFSCLLTLKFLVAISGSKSKISLKPKNVKSNLSSTYVKRLKIALLKKKENSRSVQQTIPHSASKVKLKDKKPIAIDARQRLESAHFRLFNIIVFII